jgi:hypothetical protein
MTHWAPDRPNSVSLSELCCPHFTVQWEAVTAFCELSVGSVNIFLEYSVGPVLAAVFLPLVAQQVNSDRSVSKHSVHGKFRTRGRGRRFHFESICLILYSLAPLKALLRGILSAGL